MPHLPVVLNVYIVFTTILVNMHSALNRFQNVFGFFTTVAFCTAACVAVSSIFFAQNPSAIVELRNVQVYVLHIRDLFPVLITTHFTSVKGRPHYYSPKREEYAHIKFDLDAGKCLNPRAVTLLTVR